MSKALQEPSQLAARLKLFKPSRAEPCIKSARSSRAGLPKLEPKCGLAQKARAEMWLGSKARAEPRAGSVFLFILKLFTFYNFHSSIQQINTIVFKLKQECKRNPKATSNETDPKKLYINHNGICLFYNLFTQL